MPPATDTIQRVREAIVAALDTHAALVSLTGRATRNVVPFKSRGTAVKPVLTYFVVDGRKVGGVGNTWEVLVQFSAIAGDDEEAKTHALLEVAEARLVAPVLAALAIPLDAYTKNVIRRGVDEDEAARADLDITFVVTN